MTGWFTKMIKKALLPFTYPWIYRKHLGAFVNILDVGCGDGSLMEYVNFDGKYKVTGVDLYKPYIKSAKEKGVYERVLLGDIRKIKFPKDSFDVVMSSQVIEHLEKKEALKLIKEMFKISRKKIIVGTTNGFFPFDPLEGGDSNPLQVHKSGWKITELIRDDFKVYGQGLGLILRPGGLAHRVKGLSYAFSLISYLLSPLVYFVPRLSTYIIAVKRK